MTMDVWGGDDEWQDRGCRWCTGVDEDMPCATGDCERLAVLSARRRRVSGYFAQARATLKLARRYRDEGVRDDARIRDCLRGVASCRELVRITREAMRIGVDACADTMRPEQLHQAAE